MLENIIIVGIIEYFFFYLLNHSLIFYPIKKKLDYAYNLYKVKGSRFRHLIYPLICPVCFPFHLTWTCSLISNIFTDFKYLPEAILYSCSVPIVCLILDNLILFLARENK